MTDQQPPAGWQRPPPGQPPTPPPGGWAPPPGWGPPYQRPRQPAPAGRVLLGVLLGLLIGFVAPFLPGFLAQVLFAVDLYPSGAGLWLGLAMLVTMPLGGVLGGLWAARKARR